MDLLKVLRKTTIIAGASVLAFGATSAQATDDVAYQAHISASVVGTLSVTEISAINFGNFAAATCGTTAPTSGAAASTTDYITLSDAGARTKGGCFTLLNGNSQSGISNSSGTNAYDETGGQSPGFYTIANSDGITDVYVSFANQDGAFVDSTYGSNGTYTHPNNYVDLKLAGAGSAVFAVNNFSFETDDATGGNGASGYTQKKPQQWGADNSGNYVNCGATCTLRVGATLAPLAANPAAGKYTGDFYIMVSY